MKYIYIPVSLLFLTLFTFTACGNSTKTETISDDKINVISVNFPGYDFAREIAGENINLTLLLPPGSESHSFEPTPQDIIKIQNCDIFIYAGGESDSWVKGVLGSMKDNNIKILAMMDMVAAVEEEIKEGMEEPEENEHSHKHEHEEAHKHEHDEHEEEAEYDEHVWTSPVNAAAIVKKISNALCEADETNAAIYKEKTAVYVDKLQALDSAFREITKNAKRKTLIFGDRFPFRYFVEEYGLDYYAAFPGCSTETEASAKTVAFLIDKVKQEKIPVVFNIEFSNGKIAKTICENTGAKNLLLHSCHNISSDEFKRGESYISLMTGNTVNLKEALN